VTTGRDPLRGTDRNFAAALHPADIPVSVREKYNNFSDFPSRPADKAEKLWVVRDAA